MIKGQLISADFEKSTMEFQVEQEFYARAGIYVILTEQEYNAFLQYKKLKQNK